MSAGTMTVEVQPTALTGLPSFAVHNTARTFHIDEKEPPATRPVIGYAVEVIGQDWPPMFAHHYRGDGKGGGWQVSDVATGMLVSQHDRTWQTRKAAVEALTLRFSLMGLTPTDYRKTIAHRIEQGHGKPEPHD